MVALVAGTFFALNSAGDGAALPSGAPAAAEPESAQIPGEAMQAAGGEALDRGGSTGAAAPSGRTELAGGEAPKARFALTGRLVGPSGSPLSEVQIRYAETRGLGIPGLEPSVEGSREEKATDAHGRFRFMVEGRQGRAPVPAR